jgi:hypothetical protein
MHRVSQLCNMSPRLCGGTGLTLLQNCIKLMHMNNTAREYFAAKTGERSIRAIAEKSGLDSSVTTRQLSGASGLKVETVVAICRAYDLDMAEVFVAVGFLTADEAKRFNRSFDLAGVTDLDLSKEMLRRVAAGAASESITGPVPEEIIDAVLREVEDARAAGRKSEWDLAADKRRDRTPTEEG